MSTMADAEDAILQGQARFLRWLEEFQRRWDAPLADTLAGVMWNGLDGATREQMRGIAPEASQVMDQYFRRGGENGARELQPPTADEQQQPGAMDRVRFGG